MSSLPLPLNRRVHFDVTYVSLLYPILSPRPVIRGETVSEPQRTLTENRRDRESKEWMFIPHHRYSYVETLEGDVLRLNWFLGSE